MQRAIGFLTRRKPRTIPTVCRRSATKDAVDARKTRNIALVAHIDSGKTTLTESILHVCSYLANPGSVDTGSTTTDFLPAERERGITIQSASIPVHWRHWNFNLIDTPGHADFGMEVESASRVVDGAVVLIDSVEGIEAQTKGVLRQLDRYAVPSRIVFMNKMDRPGASFHASFLSLLAHRVHPKPLALTLPVASFDPQAYNTAEPGIEGIVDLAQWKIWRWSKDGTHTCEPLPKNPSDLDCGSVFPPDHPLVPHVLDARTALLEALSMHSEKLMETLLSAETPSDYFAVSSTEILPLLRELTLKNEVLPVLCGSALQGIGSELVMDYIGELLASPLDIAFAAGPENAPLRMLAWKVVWDKRKGWMTFVRVYSGTLTKTSSLMNTTRQQRERVSKLMLFYASQPEETNTLPPGSVGVILGLKYTRTGDTLVQATGTAHSGASAVLRDISPPPAVMTSAIVPNSHSDFQPVLDAITALIRTDPSVRLEQRDGQILMHGLGSLHLEIVENRLRDEWGVQFEVGKRRVSYRESMDDGQEHDFSEPWSTDIHGKSVTVNVSLRVRVLRYDEVPDPVWDGNIVLDTRRRPVPSPDDTTNSTDPILNIAKGIANTLSNSPHSSLPLSGLHVSIIHFDLPSGVPASALSGGGATVLRNGLRGTGMGPLLEPYVRLRIQVQEDNLGKVVKDVTEHSGEVLELDSATSAGGPDDFVEGGYSPDGLYVPPSWLTPCSSALVSASGLKVVRSTRSIHAVAPLNMMLNFATRLRALTGGHGTFEMTNADFQQVSDSRRQEILQEIGRA